MPVDVYFREDIAHILRSAEQASGGTAGLVADEMARLEADGGVCTAELADHLRIYRRGYCDALNAVATAFGIGAGRQLRHIEPPAAMDIRRRVTTLSDWMK